MKAKKIIRNIIITLVVLLLAGAVYYFNFDRVGYLMTLTHRPSLEKIADNVYINKGNTADREEIMSLITEGRKRVSEWFGELVSTDSTYVLICDDSRITKIVGEKDTTTFSGNSYICISNEYFNVDIVSHEFTHSEFHHRLTSEAMKRLPTWFDEGLATQNDYREQYSPEAWAEATDNGKNTIALTDIDEPSEFYAGTPDERRVRYVNAKHEVTGWLEKHGKEGLLSLIERMNKGEDFLTVYNE